MELCFAMFVACTVADSRQQSLQPRMSHGARVRKVRCSGARTADVLQPLMNSRHDIVCRGIKTDLGIEAGAGLVMLEFPSKPVVMLLHQVRCARFAAANECLGGC